MRKNSKGGLSPVLDVTRKKELFWSLQVYRTTKRKRLKSALYPRLKKRKVFKIVKGGLFRLFENPVCCKISKRNEGATVRRHLKISKKNNVFQKKTENVNF